MEDKSAKLKESNGLGKNLDDDVKANKQKRKVDEVNLGSESPVENVRKRKRKRPSRKKNKDTDDANQVPKELKHRNDRSDNEILQDNDSDLDVQKKTKTNTKKKKKKDKVTVLRVKETEDVQTESQNQEKIEPNVKYKYPAGTSEQLQKHTKKSKEDLSIDGPTLSPHDKEKQKSENKDESVLGARQRQIIGMPSEDPNVNKEELRKKKKRRKDNNDISVTLSLEKNHQKEQRKTKGGYSDPTGDSSLSEPASKALSYAYSRAVSSPDWKFNKARQNWIIRHLWDDQMIPEKYFASCLKYLEGIQGNTRDVISKLALSSIGDDSNKDFQSSITDGSASKTADTSSENITLAIENHTEEATGTKMQRAREVLVCLGLAVQA